MKIDKVQKNSLRMKQVEKIFLSSEISTQLILLAFKTQQKKKIMASSRAYQYSPVEKKSQQKPKFNLLHVAGKQLPKSQDLSEKINKKDVLGVRIALERPLSQLMEVLEKDQELPHYLNELNLLRRHIKQKEYHSFSRNSASLRQIEVISPTRYVANGSLYTSRRQASPQEHIIMSNPILMRKVILADSSLRRQEVGLTRKMWNTQDKNRPALLLPKIEHSIEDNSFRICRQFQLTIDISNYSIHIPPSEGQYKACIQMGNNGILIKSLLQSRPWWTFRSISEIDHCNLIWTQWKNDAIKQMLKKRGRNINNGQVKGYSSHKEKAKQFSKLVSVQSNAWIHFDSSDRTYLNFGKKIDNSKFEQFCKRNFKDPQYRVIHNSKDTKIMNHLPGCLQLHSKKLLLTNLKQYVQKIGKNIEDYIPLTYHIKQQNDQECLSFYQTFQKKIPQQKGQNNHNVWICKPGENSNRGNGIAVSNNLQQLKDNIRQRCQGSRTAIIQKYIQQPLLFNKRKFDIRCFILITTVNGILKGYWYQEGYIRTTSKQYNLKRLSNRLVHLTNDAVQKKSTQYGKFEHCNKVSFADFEKYLETNHPQAPSFDSCVKKMKQISTDLIKSVANKLNPKYRQYAFELFGLDFMLDQKLKPYLIEANSNPCLEIAGTILGRIIPSVIQNVLRIAVDPIFPPPKSESQRSRYKASNFFEANKMELVYDSFVDQDIVDLEESEDDKSVENI